MVYSQDHESKISIKLNTALRILVRLVHGMLLSLKAGEQENMPMAKKTLNYLISFRYKTYWAIEFLSKRVKPPNSWRFPLNLASSRSP
jgi:hypothetical protein